LTATSTPRSPFHASSECLAVGHRVPFLRVASLRRRSTSGTRPRYQVHASLPQVVDEVVQRLTFARPDET